MASRQQNGIPTAIESIMLPTNRKFNISFFENGADGCEIFDFYLKRYLLQLVSG